MEVSPHVLLVGSGAALFAERMGAEKGELLTEYSRKFYQAFVKDSMNRLGSDYALDTGYLEEDRINYDYHL